MTESIALQVRLQAFLRRENSRRWATICPLVGVASQGRTAEEARACLQEAVELWFESCVERGVLDQALREANFRPAVSDRATDASVEDVKAPRRKRRDSTRAGLARPVIIKMDRDLGEDIVRSNMRTIGLSRKDFERLLSVVRGN
jgi:predicted RNase H-like HicB family nuclease